MKTLDKFFSIIDLLERNQSMRLKEITDSLNLDKGTAHRFLSMMYKNNYLNKNPETKKYSLGIRFLNISSKIIENFEIKDIAKPNLDRLSKITHQTIHLGILLGNNLIYIDKRDSNKAIRMYSQIGKTAPLYCTAMGKSILSELDDEDRNRIINSIVFHKQTPNTIDNKKELYKEIEKIKKQGFALDNEEHEEGIYCIGAPIKDYTQKAIGAISITFLLQYKENDILECKDLIIAEAKNISFKMGFLSE